jgi:hypothetical protein
LKSESLNFLEPSRLVMGLLYLYFSAGRRVQNTERKLGLIFSPNNIKLTKSRRARHVEFKGAMKNEYEVTA